MARIRARLRQGAYAVSVAGFLTGAVLTAAWSSRAGLVAVGVGAAALAVALWDDLGLHAAARRTALASSRRDAKAREQAILAACKRAESVAAASAEHAVAISAAVATLSSETSKLRSETADVRRQIIDFRTGQFEKRMAAIGKQVTTIGTQVDQGPSVALELARILDRVEVDPSATLPIAGGWAVSPMTLVALVDCVLSDERICAVVECGSGSSTVWTAAALRRVGRGHVYALEHDLHYARQTRQWLAAHDLQDWATVIDAPLADVEVDGELVRWFGAAVLELLPERIDLLFVDGPPGKSGPLARRPAVPLLAHRLPVGATVILDDTDREPEQQIARDWLDRPMPGRELVQHAVVGRSTFFRVVAAPESVRTVAQ